MSDVERLAVALAELLKAILDVVRALLALASSHASA